MIATAVNLKDLSKSFGKLKIIDKVSLSVRPGEFLVLVGPSGCGKSTLLRLISGLEVPDEGEVWIHNKNMTQVEPQDRDLALVFQSYALYPHMSVRENLEFGLKVRRFSKKQIEERVFQISELLKIEDLLARKPKEISGGQRQRVALGRALVRQAPLVLFDEPLSNLDAHLRSQMRFELKKIHQELKTTMIYVTHDQVEATTLADRLAILNKGKLEQIDTPKKIYEEPSSRFVAEFIGSPEINWIEGEFGSSGFFSSSLGAVQGIQSTAGGRAFLGVRPEDLSLVKTDGAVSIGTFKKIWEENLGSQKLLHLKRENLVLRSLLSSSLPSLENQFDVYLKPSRLHCFNEFGERL